MANLAQPPVKNFLFRTFFVSLKCGRSSLRCSFKVLKHCQILVSRMLSHASMAPITFRVGFTIETWFPFAINVPRHRRLHPFRCPKFVLWLLLVNSLAKPLNLNICFISSLMWCNLWQFLLLSFLKKWLKNFFLLMLKLIQRIFLISGCLIEGPGAPDVPPRNPTMSRMNGRVQGIVNDLDMDFEPSCLVRTPSGNVYIPSGNLSKSMRGKLYLKFLQRLQCVKT